MAKARRPQAPKSKRRTQAAASTRRYPPASLPLQDARFDLEPVIRPVALITEEMQSFSRRRLNKLMDASSRMMAVRDVGGVTLIQSRFVLETIEDYVSEAGQLAQLWMQALGQNWDVLRSAGEAVGRDVSQGARSAQSMTSRGMSDLAMTSAVVH
jgi:hypothetical protein